MDLFLKFGKASAYIMDVFNLVKVEGHSFVLSGAGASVYSVNTVPGFYAEEQIGGPMMISIIG